MKYFKAKAFKAIMVSDRKVIKFNANGLYNTDVKIELDAIAKAVGVEEIKAPKETK